MRLLTTMAAVACVATTMMAAAVAQTSSSSSSSSSPSGTTVESGRQHAVQDDSELTEREKQREDRRLEEELRKLRAGKTGVVKVETLRLGGRELVSVTALRDDATVVLLIPQVRRSKRQPWETPAALLAAVRALRPEHYEIVHTEEAYGVEWITGVGEGSPTTLADMERLALGRATGTATADEPKTDSSTEPAEGTAVGTFVELIDGEIDGKAYKAIVMRRGTLMTRSVLWLAKPRARGGLSAHRSSVLDEAAALKAGDTVTVQYVKVDDRLYATEFKKD
ncbi:MAG: hypothetical protein JXL80_13415 [Planctomycetes bacterium]|nr:hypothetical protein [Planctomycetota bacterium]